MNQLHGVVGPFATSILGEITRIWDDGDAIFPIDHRLPPAARSRLIERLRPATVSADGETVRCDGAVPVATGDALVIATSGTTGTPKGVVHTHESIAASAHATSAALQVQPDRDRWVACLPLAHIGGLSVITRSLVTGTPVEVHPGVDATALATAVSEGATLVSLVAAALERVDATAWRKVLLGGASPPKDRPANSVATYGLTETGSGIVYDSRPLAGVEISCGDPSLGPTSEAGSATDRIGAPSSTSRDAEVWIRCPMLARAYRGVNGPAETSHGESLADAHGWFATGDLGRLDIDGTLSVAGRSGDMINSGGQKIWPQPIEARLQQHPGIDDCLVVGLPDEQWGQRVVAEIVASSDVRPSLDELKEWVRAELPSYCAPRSIDFVTSIEKTPSGKPKRRPRS